MQNSLVKRLFPLALVIFSLWAGVRYALPLVMPFLLGLGLALAAEPLVNFSTRYLRSPRWASSALAVTATLVMLLTVLALVVAVMLRQLGRLTTILPDMEQAARQSMASLESFALKLVRRTPEGIRKTLMRWTLGLFHNDRQWSQAITEHLPAIATSILGRIPGSALTIGTAIISAYMISARLPAIRDFARRSLPQSWHEKFLPALRQAKACLGRWLTAQAKLCSISFALLWAGLLILRVSHAPMWALLIALVDAMPILGSGTVLLPWALVRLLQGDGAQALGLSAVYVTVVITRSVLEPKLVGRHLGLDPLVTLVALYAGFRIWGFFGMILAPMLAVLSTQLVKSQ